ncbi:AAA family ATPase [Pseudoteredinibacter isoporae]|uniref:Putative kinase n=1 Tax=Pseudoteredinibacter isoporae TaxID=570281 RepID=A0A7X0JRV0_9GAMM|nr:ATP-binding protein [Pseudoteredinibacter isoporae]MBB6520255.1 putative kinase [Pseudoteredinibacter isoporae]NHO85827.1 ATP-binding protein [Pseudoteredinibacter isoporae]NIB25721.1 ATP-binding protein [Pseudoteredinibacter isoporae]
MKTPVGTLTLFCGKMGAGKSTASKQLAEESASVLLSEDDWLAALYPDQIQSLESYIERSARLKPQMKTMVQSILCTGTDVVMDFPANTLAQRAWLRSIFLEVNAPHKLVYLALSDEDCLKQIAQRRLEQPERAATDTQEMFEQVTQHFVEPKPSEGFHIVLERWADF